MAKIFWQMAEICRQAPDSRQKTKDSHSALREDAHQNPPPSDTIRAPESPREGSMSSDRTTAVDVFFSYSHRDQALRDALETHLALLVREGAIRSWHDRKIGAGRDWEGEIDRHLESADLVLLLISPDFMASDYCFDREMGRALERHDAGEARVVPVILRPADWQTADFARLQALPRNAKPITARPN